MFNKIREKRIWKEVVKSLENHSLFKGITLNTIKSKACYLMLENKISEEFYIDIFYNKNSDLSHAWFELNEEKILNYYK